MAMQPTFSHDAKRVAYVVQTEPGRQELWVSDLDGTHKTKLASSRRVSVGDWSLDNSQLSYTETKRDDDRNFVIDGDGGHLRQLPPSLFNNGSMFWDRSGKFLYVSGNKTMQSPLSTWRLSVDGSSAEPFFEDCGYAMDSSLDGKYLLISMMYGDKLGIFSVSVTDKKCTPLVPGVVTFFPRVSTDGKYVLYTISSRGEVSLYRLPWLNGEATGPAHVILKLPFAFPQRFGGNAYDIAPDLSKIVYVRPGGQFDVYLRSQK
jgi:Tol biopolymer transport system component